MFIHFVDLLIPNCLIYNAHYCKSTDLKKCMSFMEYKMNIPLSHLQFVDNISKISHRGKLQCILLSMIKTTLKTT